MDSLRTAIDRRIADIRAGKVGAVTNPVSEESDAPICETCDGRRWMNHDLPIEHPDFGKAVLCQSCSPPKPFPYRLDNFIPRCSPHWARVTPGCEACGELSIALETASAFVEQDWPRWVVLLGDYGSGKTHLAYGMLRARGERDHTPPEKASVVQTQEFLSEVYSAMNHPVSDVDGEALRTEAMVMKHYQNMPLLVLDELGRESQTHASANRLSALMNHRYANKSRTIITSNLYVEDIQRIWPNIASRLRDGSLGVILNLWSVPDARPAKGTSA